MNPMPQLTPHLKQLRLSGILDSLEVRNRQAVEQKLAYTDFLALLILRPSSQSKERNLIKLSQIINCAHSNTNTIETAHLAAVFTDFAIF